MIRALIALMLVLGQTTTAPKTTFAPKTSLSAGGSGGGGGGTLVLRHQISVDSGATGSVGPLDLGSTINATGDLLVVMVTGGGTNEPTAICDSTSSSACSVSASTYTIGTTTCNATSISCSTIAWTCNAAANVRFFSVTLAGSNDETVTVADWTHNITGACHDASASAQGDPAGATLTSSAYTTVVANEVAEVLMAADDGPDGCGPLWNGTAGTGFTLHTLATACLSMLGAGEYQVYTATQSSVTASINMGNESTAHVGMRVETFE